MQNISVLMSPRSPSGFTDIKKPNVLHHPVQAKNLHFNLEEHHAQKMGMHMLAYVVRTFLYDTGSSSYVHLSNHI